MKNVRIGSVIYEKRTKEKGEVLDIVLSGGETLVRVFIEGYEGYDEYSVDDFFYVFTDKPVFEIELPKEKTVYKRKSNGDIYYVHSNRHITQGVLIITVSSSGDMKQYTPEYFDKNFEEY